MKLKRTFVMAALLAMSCVIALDGAALAQPEGRRGPGPPGGPGASFGPHHRPPGPPGLRPPSLEDLERAGVTAAQRAKIEKLHDESMRRVIRMRADLQIAELDLHKLIESDDSDEDAVDAAIDRVGELRTALHKAHVAEMRAVRVLLTPEQRARLKKRTTAPQSQEPHIRHDEVH